MMTALRITQIEKVPFSSFFFHASVTTDQQAPLSPDTTLTVFDENGDLSKEEVRHWRRLLRWFVFSLGVIFYIVEIAKNEGNGT